jgi:hypothetical protein
VRAPASKRSNEEIVDDILKVAGEKGFVIGGENPKYPGLIKPIKPLVLKLINDLRA